MDGGILKKNQITVNIPKGDSFYRKIKNYKNRSLLIKMQGITKTTHIINIKLPKTNKLENLS